MTDAWVRTLDECEARLDAAAETIDGFPEPGSMRSVGTGPLLAPFLAEGPPEPFPAELVDRALALVRRSVELEHRLTDQRDRVSSELRRIPRQHRQAPHPESHFELKA